jgi:hypothetical protein
LGQEGPGQYSVLINFLPKNLRSKQALGEYMEYSFPHLVRSVHVAVDAGKLEGKVERRAEVRNDLEHALAVFYSTPSTRTGTGSQTSMQLSLLKLVGSRPKSRRAKEKACILRRVQGKVSQKL